MGSGEKIRLKSIGSPSSGILGLAGIILLLACSPRAFGDDEDEVEIPMGKAYRGPKAQVGVGRFTVEVRGAPGEMGEGLRAMLLTALFESNHFIVMDRFDMEGITAEQLLSDSFLAGPDAILAKGQMEPAELLVSGAVIAVGTEESGIYFKLVSIPLKVGAISTADKVVIEVRVVDSATGKVIAAEMVEGTASKGTGVVGTDYGGLPVELSAFARTPLELAIRDCIYRAVISLCKIIPQKYFKHVD